MIRKATAVTLAAAFLAMSMFVGTNAGAQDNHVKWSFLVYLAADNHLDGDVYGVPLVEDALGQLMSVGSTDSVAVHALVDRHSEPDNLFKVNKGELVPMTGFFALSGTEFNTGDPNTLRSFVEYTESLAPAEYTSLIIWDSGSLGYIAKDVQGEPIHGYYNYDIVDYLTHQEVVQALDGLNVDILGADECNIGYMEIAYEYAVHQTARYLVTAPTYIGWRGFPYDAILAEMTEHPDMDARHAAVMMVEQRQLFLDQPPYQMERTNAFSAIDLAKVKDLASSLKVLTGLVTPKMADYINIVNKARSQANMAYAQNPMNRIDLMTFVKSLDAKSSEFDGALDAVISDLDAAVMALQTTGTTDHMTSGLGIYMPNHPSELPDIYRVFAFPAEGWMAFLEAYWSAHGKT